jgi:hypothetical protein
MKLTYEQSGDTQRYQITVHTDDGNTQTLGVMQPFDAEQWVFTPDGRISLSNSDDHGADIHFPATDFESAKARLDKRLGVVDMGKPRLANKLMHDHTTTLLRVANALACQTSSLPGYITGITEAFARLLHEDIADGREEGTLERFNTQVREMLKKMQEDQRTQQQAIDSLGALIGSLMPSEEPPEATKH